MLFRREAVRLEDGRSFSEALEPWQAEDFAALDSGKYRNAYLERPRGHSKTFDTASEAAAELVLGRTDARLYCCAADLDQAGLLFDDVAAIFRRSPLLERLVKVTGKEITVTATGSRLRVLASDAPSAYGLRPDWIAADELAEWRKPDLYYSLVTATGKRPCRMMVITTPGWDRSGICWQVRQNAEREDDWYFSARGPCASWISPDWREQQRRILPAHVFARLHEGRWVEGAGAFLMADEVDACFADALPDASGPMAIGLDIGLSDDRTVLALVRNAEGTAVVEGLTTWRGSSSRRVDLVDVEREAGELAERTGAPVVLDPWQGVLLAQRLRAAGVRVIEFKFSADARRKMFATLLDFVRNRRLKARPHADLRAELLGLEVEETASGWRVDHRPGRHDDHAVAVGLALQHVAEGAPRLQLFIFDGPEKVEDNEADWTVIRPG